MKTDSVHNTIERKRRNIIKNAHANEVPAEYEQALQQMEDYLRQQNKRCTVERRFVLEMLYRLSSPIDLESFHELVCVEKGSVARSTIYNTMDLLVQLKLAKRLDLVSHGMSFYEKTLGMEPHGYVICDQCGNINMLYRPDLLQTLKLSLPRGFVPEDYTLHVHGLCSKCKRRKNKAENIGAKTENKSKKTKTK